MTNFMDLPPHRHGDDAHLCDVSAARTDGETGETPHHVVIVGAGFGGLAAAKALGKARLRVTIIDQRNHHLFQPLLYQVATAALSPAEIATPIRAILRDQKNTTVLLGKVTGVDTARREVILETQHILYDTLIIATGARHAYFGHNEWELYAPGLKSLEDATEIRRRILLAFERAEIECDEDERRRLLTFVVIGGGPTGVELAGAIAEISRHALAADFRNIDPKSARAVLIEAGPRLLPSFPESLSESARKTLTSLGVEVRLGAPVTLIDADGVVMGGERLEARTVLWGAGVAASPAARWLGAPADRAGRVMVGPDLRVPGFDNVFAIGDTAHAEMAPGKPLPGVAPVAKQQGMYVARVIVARTRGRAAPPKFAYQDFGNMATVGRTAAVVDFGRVRISGFPAWLLWSIAHVYFLIGNRSRIAVAINWLWAYLTFERGARLITHGESDAPVQAAEIAPPPLMAVGSATSRR
jgi:NADH dehydrogenase FAD-containing subunit